MQQATRRSVMMGAACLAGASVAGRAAKRRGFFERAKLPIGLQLYMLGGGVGGDLDGTFAQVARIGYREIQLPALYGRSARDIAAAAGRAGLSIGSLHLPLVARDGPSLSLASDPAKVADTLGALGARWVVAPLLLLPAGMRAAKGETAQAVIARSVAADGADVWKRSAALLNERAAALKPLGIRVAYHNHNLEFAPVGGTTGWEILRRETDPTLVAFEIDVGWVAAAGVDPVTLLDANRGRVALLHVKDIAAGGAPDFALAMRSTPVGAGRLDWARILPAAYRAGARHFLVEQEPPFEIPRIDAAARSYAFLSTLKA